MNTAAESKRLRETQPKPYLTYNKKLEDKINSILKLNLIDANPQKVRPIDVIGVGDSVANSTIKLGFKSVQAVAKSPYDVQTERSKKRISEYVSEQDFDQLSQVLNSNSHLRENI